MKTFTQSIMFVATALVLAGCGNPGQAFVGLYSASGTMTATLNLPQGPQTVHQQLSGNINFYEGVASDLMMSASDDSRCVVAFKASDFDTATVVPGTSCTSTAADGWTTTVVYNSGSAARNGNMVTYNATGTMTGTKDGATVTGSFTTMATFTRLSK